MQSKSSTQIDVTTTNSLIKYTVSSKKPHSSFPSSVEKIERQLQRASQRRSIPMRSHSEELGSKNCFTFHATLRADLKVHRGSYLKYAKSLNVPNPGSVQNGCELLVRVY